MTLIYLASPYSHDDSAIRLKRFHEVCKKASEMMLSGEYLVFSPIAHTHPIAVGWGLPLGFDYWEAFNRRMIAACDEVHVLCLPGWEQSVGVQSEIHIAHDLDKPVRYIEP